MMHRRATLAAAFALALTSMIAGAATPQERSVQLPLKQLFPFLEAYLSLPSSERSKFELVYRIALTGADPARARLSYPGGAAAQIGVDGRILQLPTLQMMKSGGKAMVTGPQGVRMKVDLAVEPKLLPAAEMNAVELADAVAQAKAGAAKAAGLFRFAAPKLQKAVIRGVRTGQVIDGGGASRPLPFEKGRVVFEPAKHPRAARLKFDRAPQRVTIE
jgi:hypothetical protein